MRHLWLLLLTTPAAAQQAGWGNVGEAQEKAFSWTDPLWPSFWMAWTPVTLAFFVALFTAMGIITFIEIRKPGTSERDGALGLTTTRGDRLFLSLLGSAYIFLGWLGFFGMPLWIPLGLAVLWGVFCFLRV